MAGFAAPLRGMRGFDQGRERLEGADKPTRHLPLDRRLRLPQVQAFPETGMGPDCPACEYVDSE